MTLTLTDREVAYLSDLVRWKVKGYSALAGEMLSLKGHKLREELGQLRALDQKFTDAFMERRPRKTDD